MLNEIQVVKRLVAGAPPMSAEAFTAGRRRLLKSLPGKQNPRHWQLAHRTVRVLWWVALAVLLVALSSRYLLDLEVYRTGGLAWWLGLPLYHDFPGRLDGPRLPFTYPPIAAVLFGPLAALPAWLANALASTASFLALSAVCVVVAGKLSPRKEIVWTLGPAAAILAIGLEPVISTFTLGQINLVLMALVVLDCFVIRDPRRRGLLVGLAAAIKLTPAMFVLYFLLRRDRRAAVNAIAAFTALSLLGFLAAPTDSTEYWFHALLDPSRIGGLAYTTNQSLRGVLARLQLDTIPLLWLGLAAAVTLLAALVAYRTRDDILALLAIAAAGLLASPVSWSHHWVWLVPALLLAAARSRTWWQHSLLAVTLLIYCSRVFMLPPNSDHRELAWTFWQHIPGNVYVWVTVVALIVAGTRSARPWSPPAPPPAPSAHSRE